MFAFIQFVRILIAPVVFAVPLVTVAVGRVDIPALAALTTIIHDSYLRNIHSVVGLQYRVRENAEPGPGSAAVDEFTKQVSGILLQLELRQLRCDFSALPYEGIGMIDVGFDDVGDTVRKAH